MFKQILIVGLGLIGGSFAKKLSKLGYKVVAIDIDKSAIDYAYDNGFICNSYYTEAELIRRSDLIIICLYPDLIIPWLKKNAGYIQKGTIITDVCGVKTNLIKEIQNLNLPQEYISIHPMAGREVKGIKNSQTDLFDKANMIIVKGDKNSVDNIMKIKKLATNIGFKNIMCVSVEEHDNLIAYLSQLPHAIAVSLINARNCEHMIQYTGDSFRDLTRIADINEKLWVELFMSNKENLVHEINIFIEQLENVKNCLLTSDNSGLEKLFINSSDSRKKFDL